MTTPGPPGFVSRNAPTAVTPRSQLSFNLVSRPPHGETGTGTNGRGTSDE
jgi:hypothetical protein